MDEKSYRTPPKHVTTATTTSRGERKLVGMERTNPQIYEMEREKEIDNENLSLFAIREEWSARRPTPPPPQSRQCFGCVCGHRMKKELC